MTNQSDEGIQPEVIDQKPKPVSEPADLVISEPPAGLTTWRASADLLRYPRHILSAKSRGEKQTNIRLGDRKKGQSYWWVSSNPSYDVPGKTAFDFDYQILHQKFHEALLNARQNGHKTAPRYVVVGSLREIAKELGLSPTNTKEIKKAIQANQATVIETDQAVRFINEKGELEHLSGQFNAYNVYIRGDHLPDGHEAKKVILELSIPFWQALNCQDFAKPLDGQYFKQLGKPGAQRWYTLVSTDMFVALNKNLPYAKIRYSEYCKFHPQKRHTAFSDMKRQMEKLHQKHIDLEYIEAPRYQKITAEQGINDWWILYKPGQLAREEYQRNRQRRFTKSAPRELPEQPEQSQESYNLVSYFQKQKNNHDIYSPTTKELNQAAELINKYGLEKAKRLVILAIQEMAKTNFKAIYFGAVLNYETSAIETLEIKEQYRQEQAEQQKAEYQEKIKEYQDWLKKTPDERIQDHLDNMTVFNFKQKYHRDPTPEEYEQMRQELLESSRLNPTPEQKQIQLFGRIVYTD